MFHLIENLCTSQAFRMTSFSQYTIERKWRVKKTNKLWVSVWLCVSKASQRTKQTIHWKKDEKKLCVIRRGRDIICLMTESELTKLPSHSFSVFVSHSYTTWIGFYLYLSASLFFPHFRLKHLISRFEHSMVASTDLFFFSKFDGVCTTVRTTIPNFFFSSSSAPKCISTHSLHFSLNRSWVVTKCVCVQPSVLNSPYQFSFVCLKYSKHCIESHTLLNANGAKSTE